MSRYIPSQAGSGARRRGWRAEVLHGLEGGGVILIDRKSAPAGHRTYIERPGQVVWFGSGPVVEGRYLRGVRFEVAMTVSAHAAPRNLGDVASPPAAVRAPTHSPGGQGEFTDRAKSLGEPQSDTLVSLGETKRMPGAT